MRVIKEHDERRNEILDAAERLFNEKGYDRCTINDILEAVGIARGTFYYYFESKEEVLDAIVSRINDMVINRANEILNLNFTPDEKLMRTFAAIRLSDKVDDAMLDNIHRPENALLHQKTWSQIVEALSPVLQKIVEEGIQKKIWSCKYPLQYMQIILVSSLILTDEGIFNTDEDSENKIMAALVSLLEKMLEVPQGYFIKLYIKYFGSRQ